MFGAVLFRERIEPEPQCPAHNVCLRNSDARLSGAHRLREGIDLVAPCVGHVDAHLESVALWSEAPDAVSHGGIDGPIFGEQVTCTATATRAAGARRRSPSRTAAAAGALQPGPRHRSGLLGQQRRMHVRRVQPGVPRLRCRQDQRLRDADQRLQLRQLQVLLPAGQRGRGRVLAQQRVRIHVARTVRHGREPLPRLRWQHGQRLRKQPVGRLPTCGSCGNQCVAAFTCDQGSSGAYSCFHE